MPCRRSPSRLGRSRSSGASGRSGSATAIGAPRANGVTVFDPPTLETVVAPRDVGDRAALHAALVQLAEQDPLIGLRQDDARHELSVSLYGEVQKEVIEATLADDYGIAVEFRETTMICIERPLGAGAAVEPIGAETNQYAATVGLRIEPAPPGSGIEFRLEVELRSVPLYVYKTVDDFASSMEAYVRASLERGPRRLARRRLCRDDDGLRLRRAGDGRGRLPQADAGRADACAPRGGHGRLRADPPLPPRRAAGRGAPDAARARSPACRGARRPPRPRRRAPSRARSRRRACTCCSASCAA